MPRVSSKGTPTSWRHWCRFSRRSHVQEFHGISPHTRTAVGSDHAGDLHTECRSPSGRIVDEASCEGHARERNIFLVSSTSEHGKLCATEGDHLVDCCILPGTVSAVGVDHAVWVQHQAPQAEQLVERARHCGLMYQYMTRMPQVPQGLTADTVLMHKRTEDGGSCLHAVWVARQAPQAELLVERTSHRELMHQRMTGMPQVPQALTADTVLMDKQTEDGGSRLLVRKKQGFANRRQADASEPSMEHKR